MACNAEVHTFVLLLSGTSDAEAYLMPYINNMQFGLMHMNTHTCMHACTRVYTCTLVHTNRIKAFYCTHGVIGILCNLPFPAWDPCIHMYIRAGLFMYVYTYNTPCAYRHKLHYYECPLNNSFIWGTACIKSTGVREIWWKTFENVILP